MFDQFLTSLLKIVIVIDILGAIAYFVLGGLKHQRRQALQATLNAQTVQVVPLRKSFQERLGLGKGGALWNRLPWKKPCPVLATQGDFDQLRRVLYSYQEGLA